MKRFLQLCVAIVLLHFGALAQTTSKVTIEVKNNGFSLDSFVVSLQGDKETKAEHKYRDTNISVIVPKTQKKIYVKVKSNTYINIDTIYSVKPNITIELTKKPEEIKEVVVTSYKKIQEGNNLRQIFKIDPKTISNITNAEMALRRTPGIYMSEGYLRILGDSEDATIYIDELQASKSDLEFLKASEIDKIEVIPSLSSKSGGTIRIYKKKVQRANYRVNLGYNQDFFNGNSSVPKASAVYQTKTFYISSSAYTRISNDISNTSLNIKPKTGIAQEYNTDSRSKTNQTGVNLKMSWTPTKKSTLLFNANTNYVSFNDKNELSYLGKTTNQELYDKDNTSYVTASYKYNVYRGAVGITGATIYTISETTAKSGTQNAKTTYMQNILDAYFYNWFTLFGKDGYYNMSYRYTERNTSNTIIKDNIQHINSVNLETYYNVLDNLAISGSLNFEHSYLSNLNKYYFNINPEVALAYSVANNNFSLSYSKYVVRPVSYQISPEISQISAYKTRVGNTSLTPSSYNDVQLRYSRQIKNAYLSLSCSYENGKNIIGLVSTDNFNTKYDNIGAYNKYSFSLGLYKPLFNHKMIININLTGGYTKFNLYPSIEKHSSNVSDDGYDLMGVLNISYVPTNNWDLSLYTMYQPFSYDLNIHTYHSPDFVFTIRRSFLDGKLSANLSLMRLFSSFNTKSITKLRDYTQTSLRRVYMSNISIGVKFMFGQYFNERDASIDTSSKDVRL